MKTHPLWILAAAWLVTAGLPAQTPPAVPPPPAAAPKAPVREEQTKGVRAVPTRLLPAATNAPATPAPVVPAAQAQTPTPPPPAVPAPSVPSVPPPSLPAPGGPRPPGSVGGIPVVGQIGNAPAAAGLRGDQMVSMENLRFQNMPLEQFLDFYAEFVGKTVIRGTAMQALLNAQITLKAQSSLSRNEAIQAMESVMAQNGVVVVPLGEKFITVVPAANAVQEAAPFRDGETAKIADSQSFETRIVQLKHAKPSEVAQVLATLAKTPNGILPIDSNQVLVLRDYAVNIKRMLELVEKIDVDVPLDVELELIPVKYALASDVAVVLGSLTSGGAVTTGASRTGTTSRTGTLNRPGGTTGGVGGVGTGTLGQPGGVSPLGGQAGTPTSLSNAAGARTSFQSTLQSIAQRAAQGGAAPILGDAKIIPDERTNALLIFATKQERNMIKDILKQLDVVQQQVLIEAVIMEVSLNDNRTLGVSMAQNPIKAGNNSFTFGGSKFSDFGSSLTNALPGGLPSGFNYYGLLGSNWEVAFNAIAGDGNINVLSRPRIQTSHAVEASLFVGQTVPFITGNFTDINGGNRSQFQNQQVGITLQVLPLINQEGLVVMDIVQQVQQLGDDRTIDGNPVPTTTERNASAKVAVRDGETIMLGGFISSTKRSTKSGVPYLKDIPLLGALFRSKTDVNDRVELIVLIRPTVLPTPEVASVVANREREKLSGVRKAEMMLLEEEKKLSDKAEAEMKEMQEKKAKQKP